MIAALPLAYNPLRRYLHHAVDKASPSAPAPFALVTGATGGMGEEWAYQLAEHGFNIIIQGRNRTKLEKVRQAILDRHAKTFSKRQHNPNGSAIGRLNGTGSGSLGDEDDEDEDAAARQAGAAAIHRQDHALAAPIIELLVCEAVPWPNDKLVDGLAEYLGRADVRLTIVINNLGVQSEGYPRLEELSRDEMAGIVVANSLFPAEVTRSCLPHLKNNAPSLCVTVTSIGAWTPTPYLSPYMGTKGFDVAFSHSLRSEMLCEGADVDVVCMVPGQVQSGMCLEPESLMVPTSRDWVSAAIASLRPGGLLGAVLPGFLLPRPESSSWWARPKGVVTPWWPHYLGMKVAQWGPTWLLDSVAVRTVVDLKQKHAAAAQELETKRR